MSRKQIRTAATACCLAASWLVGAGLAAGAGATAPAASPTGAGAPLPAPRVTLHTRGYPRPGGVVVLTLDSDRALDTPEAYFRAMRVRLWPSGQRQYQGIVGLPVDLKPGTYGL
ncbi:MAG: hypothetical protein JOY51_08980 [Nevskia sp.]|nr:hypothetical protein [Nevskia sp.]